MSPADQPADEPDERADAESADDGARRSAMGPAGDEPEAEAVLPMRRPGPLTWVLLALVLAFVVLALTRNWDAVSADLQLLGFWDIAASGLAAAVAALCFGLAWLLVLGELGHRVPLHPGLAMFFAAQLGKYVPGSVWTAVIQAEMGRQRGLKRTNVVMAYAVTLIISVASGAFVALLVLIGGDTAGQLPLVVIGLIVGAALLVPLFRPQLFNRLITWAAAKAGRRIPTLHLRGRILAGSLAISTLAWGAYGLHVWFLARVLGADVGDLPAATGAFALAFVAGLLVVPLPAGAGVREGILVAALAPTIGAQAALTVSLVSRLLLLLVDLLLAAAWGGLQAALAIRRKQTH